MALISIRFLYLITCCAFVVIAIIHVLLTMINGDHQPLFKDIHHRTGDLSSHNLLAVVVVLSSPFDEQGRHTLRETWLQWTRSQSLSNGKRRDDIQVVFPIGIMGIDAGTLSKLKIEAENHGDMVLLGDLIESYRGLTNKILRTMCWLNDHFMKSFRYFVKVDIDSFVNIHKLAIELENETAERLYWGYFDGRATPKTEGEQEETNWNICDHYLPYAVGGGYILSSDLVLYIARNAPFLSVFVNEDVSVGAWLAVLNIRRRHDIRFDTEFKSRGCKNDFLITHKQDLTSMNTLFHNVEIKGHLCDAELLKRKYYLYNWLVSPSQCCSVRHY